MRRNILVRNLCGSAYTLQYNVPLDMDLSKDQMLPENAKTAQSYMCFSHIPGSKCYPVPGKVLVMEEAWCLKSAKLKLISVPERSSQKRHQLLLIHQLGFTKELNVFCNVALFAFLHGYSIRNSWVQLMLNNGLKDPIVFERFFMRCSIVLYYLF